MYTDQAKGWDELVPVSGATACSAEAPRKYGVSQAYAPYRGAGSKLAFGLAELSTLYRQHRLLEQLASDPGPYRGSRWKSDMWRTLTRSPSELGATALAGLGLGKVTFEGSV